MRIEVRIRQSEIRFRSGIKLILFVAVAASIAWIINVLWLAKLLLFLLYFFLSLRYLNFLMLVGLRKGCNDIGCSCISSSACMSSVRAIKLVGMCPARLILALLRRPRGCHQLGWQQFY